MRDITEDLRGLVLRRDEAEQYLRITDLRSRRPQLETEASRPDLWDSPDVAREVTGELNAVAADLEMFDDLCQRIEDIETLTEMASEEGEASLDAEIEEGLSDLKRRFDALELRSLFTGEYDANDAICEVHSGEGGTDAQDWAEILVRMYQRWAGQKGLVLEIDDIKEGTEAGISSATFTVTGRYAYGMLRGEQGTHRLVRLSPFNAQNKRMTAFAGVSVVPMIDDAIDAVEIDEKDLRWDFYRASGAGGQHINKTDSAVRITHEPTGVVVACQNERSQHQNKEKAMQILAARLLALERQRRAEELDEISGPKTGSSMGTQIRSYVLQPYQQVKDLRSGVESGNVNGVLDGDLDGFVEGYLRWERGSDLDG